MSDAEEVIRLRKRLREEVRNRQREAVGLAPIQPHVHIQTPEVAVAVEEPQLPKTVEPVLSNEERLVPFMSDQHPIHGIVGEVFAELGGKQWLFEWAEENPSKFVGLLKSSIPSINPMQGRQGDLVIRIESSLTRTNLDDETIIDVN
jgi:hypothetical protein